MHFTLKAAAVALCCTGWAFADSVATDQTPPANTPSATVLAADRGNVDPMPAPDGVRRWRYVESPQQGPDKEDGQDGRDQRGGRMGPRGRMGGWMMQAGRENGDRGQRQPKGLILGVATDSPDPALASQLNLPDGIGLVVEQVLPDSSAERAGLEQYDVLKKLDDQLVVNVEQVGVLIRMHKPGDEITLTVIRHGKTKELTATLGNSGPRRPDGGRDGHGNRPPRRHQDGDDNREPGPTPDTSGAPAPPPPPPHHHAPPKPKDDNEDSGVTPAPSTQPAELQASAEIN